MRIVSFSQAPDGTSHEGADESLPYPTKFLADYPRTKVLAEKSGGVAVAFDAIDKALRQLPQLAAVQSTYRKIDEVPYDFIRKRLSIVVEGVGENGTGGTPVRHLMITKGAFKNVFERCSALDKAGQAVPIGAREARLQRGGGAHRSPPW